jgi:hypothetical protein
VNGFELTGVGDPLKIDFDTQTSDTTVGYQSYRATDRDMGSFTAQTFSAFSTTITVDAAFGTNAAGLITASVTDTSTSPLAPTASFTTDYTGEYTVELTVADASAQIGFDTATITVYADACAAAQASGFSFNYYDSDDDCDVDLVDFAVLAAQWLDDVNLTVGYTE